MKKRLAVFLDRARSCLVGDAAIGTWAAHAASVRGILVLAGQRQGQVSLLETHDLSGCPVVPDLEAAVDYILDIITYKRNTAMVPFSYCFPLYQRIYLAPGTMGCADPQKTGLGVGANHTALPTTPSIAPDNMYLIPVRACAKSQQRWLSHCKKAGLSRPVCRCVGELNYASKELVNIENQSEVADWPCFSRYYVTFSLYTLLADSVIISATFSLHHFGNAGDSYEPVPEPSYIQILTVQEDWDETALTCNNAPLALENTSAAWVDPLDSFPGWPGISREWDVSRAVAEAHSTGDPLRLALHVSDWATHSGKYFVSSDTDDWNEEGRPTLTATWGHVGFDLNKTAYPTAGDRGSFITSGLHFLGTGQDPTLIDRLPIGASAPDSLELEGTRVPPAHDSDQHHLTWADSPPNGQPVTIRYPVTMTTSNRQMLTNIASLSEAGGETTAGAVAVTANSYRLYLPFTTHHWAI